MQLGQSPGLAFSGGLWLRKSWTVRITVKDTGNSASEISALRARYGPENVTVMPDEKRQLQVTVTSTRPLTPQQINKRFPRQDREVLWDFSGLQD